MGTTTMSCKNGMTIHGVADANNQVYFYTDASPFLGTQDFDITTGQPGIGVRNTTSNTISLAQVGPLDTAAPGTVPTTQVSTNVNWRSVEMQWQGAADDIHGIGISGYNMFRNGTYLGFKRNSTFVDDTLSPSTTYTYAFTAVDLHNNSSGTTTFNITTPPLYQGSQWTTGVRSTGNYWGSMGENIDLPSGNLNYTIPLLSAKSRPVEPVSTSLTIHSNGVRMPLASGSTESIAAMAGAGSCKPVPSPPCTPITGPSTITSSSIPPAPNTT